MNFTARVENWHTYQRVSRTTQKRESYLCGEFYGHPNMLDGTISNTSHIVESQDGYVKTYSGSVYLLGKHKPNQEL
jgi:hypothetical protein